ncbi:Type I restriction enzyme R protein N terminus (HSDR_N) [Desulfonatronum zhilinae]|nr:Type I restriction enzyme R protein N terminus (HSDR_N) [Desulfonatronum zhilinae]
MPDTTQVPVPATVQDLIQRFAMHREAYKSPDYNETQVRREFIDPLFKALGWDVDNEKGYAEQWKEVVHEDALKIGGATKAPDYSFRLGGRRLFFLEAKKPSVNLREAVAPAFQLRRYAWTAKLPLSILTDFEEFSVYDTRIKPAATDKASTARILYFTFEEYAERWADIVAIFSPEAIRMGAFDKYVQSTTQKRGTAEVDDAFLLEIETWREKLARNIALRNAGLTQRELNFAVQRIIDRIIFLRISEDRGVERYGRLQALLNGENVYARLQELFDRADKRYNSGLFHFEREKGRPGVPDELTPRLTIDDKTLKDIFRRLYYPECPYEFSVLSAEILGHVYERFLGSVIRLTEGGRAKVEQKPEVRKAGGVFYTPAYIVEYIVRHTVGELVRDKTPQEAAGMTQTWKPAKNRRPLTVLDPACGSGSFLLGAYQFLLDWHLDRYAQEPDKWSKGKEPRIYRHHRGGWRLSTEERKRILLTHIHGVDIDAQAVEVTKLSLLLKVLEGETSDTIQRQHTLFQQRALPDLSANIKCGNSLVGPDFFRNRQLSFLGDDEMYQVNAFDWNAEFPEVMQNGGFDAVIGNPPYVRQEGLGPSKEYFSRAYATYAPTADLYVPFIEKGVSLLAPGGNFAYIVANKWMRANYGKGLREWLCGKGLMEIVDFGDLPVFQNATTYPCILRIANSPPRETVRAVNVKTLDIQDLTGYVQESGFDVPLANLAPSGWTLVRHEEQALLQKLRSVGVPLGEYVKGKIYRGILTGLNKAFVIDTATRDQIIADDPKSAELIKPFLAGRDIKRYVPLKSDKFLIFTRRGVNINDYPGIKAHLTQFKAELTPKPKGFKGPWKGRKPGPYQWYEIQDTVAYYQRFEQPKIIVPAIVQRASYQLDLEGYFSNDKTSIIATEDLYLLGLLNSKVPDYELHKIASTKQGGYYEYKPMYIEQLPIRPIDSANPKDLALHDKLVALVERILDLHKRSAFASTSHEQTLLQRQIAATDQEIDQLVYALYGLSREEIAIVEAAG